LLAALHYNENAGRPQATNKEGKEEYSLHFPKYRKGGCIVVKIPVKTTYGNISIFLPFLVLYFYFIEKLTRVLKIPGANAGDFIMFC
jgi:hypothetical protein